MKPTHKQQFSDKEKFSEERTGIFAEYQSLRSEIQETQRQRLQIISLTVGAFGGLLAISAGYTLNAENTTPHTQIVVAVGGAIALYAILIPSLIMMLSAQQAIQRLGEYIRIFIEPLIPGLNWESRWREYKLRHNYKGGLRGMGGIYYFLSLLPLFLPLYTVSQSPYNWPLLLTIIPFFGWALFLAYDLHAAKSRGWKWAKWEDNKEDSQPLTIPD